MHRVQYCDRIDILIDTLYLRFIHLKINFKAIPFYFTQYCSLVHAYHHVAPVHIK